MHRDRVHLPVPMRPQSDETTCGPTCLHAVYGYWARRAALGAVFARTGTMQPGGSVAVFLACDAPCAGFDATICTYILNAFDPSWFRPGADLVATLREILPVEAP